MKLLFRYVKKYKWYLLLNFLSASGFILVELGLPTIFAKMIDEGILQGNLPVVWQYGIYMFVIIIVGGLGLATSTYFVAKITTRVIEDIRMDIFHKTRAFSMSEFNYFGVSSLMTRTNNDAYQLMYFLQMALRIGLIAPVMIIASIYMCIRTSPSLSVTFLVAFPLLIVAVGLTAYVTAPISTQQQQTLDSMNRIMREGLTGIRVIRAFVREKFQLQRFKEVNAHYAQLSKRLFYFLALAAPAFGLLVAGMVISIIWLGGHQIIANTLKIGELTAYIEYIFQSLFAFMMFTTLFAIYPRMVVSARRIQRVLDMPITIFDQDNSVEATDLQGIIEFKNVSFAYADEPNKHVLKNINLHIMPGQTVAFIGSTGSGKSTLLKLIPRLHDVSEGEILVDGIDVRQFKLSDLRQKIGYVPQKVRLFTGTIAQNLRVGDENATTEKLQQAAAIAQAAEFIAAKKEGMDHVLAEGGQNLSGGQKQRLAIARALVRSAEFYIIDDAFSALDYKTSAKVQAGLESYAQDTTVVLVAQRVASIKHADCIFVLDQGEIVGQGKHHELLASCPLYYDIASSQLSKEELI